MVIGIENDWLKVEFLSNGAEIRKVTHKKTGLDYMWSGDDKYWGRVAPVLFPIVGRLKGDQYEFNGQTYSMSQHGFLRDVTFELHAKSETNISFDFESAGQYTSIFPFEFKAFIHYELKEDTLIVQWEILNENKEEMYFSIGAHPAFKVPLLENEAIEDYSLHFTPSTNKNVIEYELKDSLIHEKGTANDISMIKISDSLFKDDALVYSNIDRIKLISTKSGHGVEVMFEAFPFVGIWSKYMEDFGTMAPFVCIEPWYGIADTYQSSGKLEEKLGINKLGIGENFKTDYKIKFL